MKGSGHKAGGDRAALSSRSPKPRAIFDLTFPFSEDPEGLGLGVMRHANTEFEYIARLLRSLYHAENRAVESVPMPR